MNTLTIKAKLFAALLASSAAVSTTTQAEELVSLETAVEMLVSQQSHMVFNQVRNHIANSIEQEVASFKIDSMFASDKGVPTVTISEMDNTININEDEDSSEDLPK
ncbi:hypothetical protein [Thalassomonas sp. M1454]|uniref:hypothetical protein n=1 Tax=Thalassomonas sp. M1454 TaxID=2594477 RepID=UPI00117F49A9|nr:hypothetical protein [Thalassomonas sp. M1454]TRX53476.1 hypothetical protein FNN08_14490 [Thalassomonas sp. M1454]